MSELLDFDNGSESISDIIYESNMTEMELHAEDVGRYVKYFKILIIKISFN